jgi:hypothetical protein
MQKQKLMPAQYYEKRRAEMCADIAGNGNISAAASIGD